MDNIYKIDVNITPNYIENKYKPYSWVLLKYEDGEWINQCFGWEESPEKSWSEAYKFYLTFKKCQ